MVDHSQIWSCDSFTFNTNEPIVMGILNMTPDSFSDGNKYQNVDEAFEYALKMIDDGAHIIDIGGESTRPGADDIDVNEELQRVLPIVEALSERGVCVSIDTRHPCVAKEALWAGASIINDVSGFTNPQMLQVAENCDAGLVVMHMRGNPKTMQQQCTYTDVVSEVKSFLLKRAKALEDAGVAAQRICLDPGPGFSKTAEQTLELMRNISQFVRTGYIVMAAPSRKSYLCKAFATLSESKPEERDIASAEECVRACEQGAHVLRVHNVPLTVAALKEIHPYVLLGLGLNQVPQEVLDSCNGNEIQAKKKYLLRVIGRLALVPDITIIDVSSMYESEPAYYEDQEKFLNAVVLLRCDISPQELLDHLHSIEREFGRVRDRENGPRTCDIDILDYQGVVLNSGELILPHPRVCERDFVVKPLLELLPYHVLANGVMVNSVPENNRLGKARMI